MIFDPLDDLIFVLILNTVIHFRSTFQVRYPIWMTHRSVAVFLPKTGLLAFQWRLPKQSMPERLCLSQVV